MNKIVTRSSIAIIFLCFCIDRISTANYELVEGYPASVKDYRGESFHAQRYYNDYNARNNKQNDFQNDQPDFSQIPYRPSKTRRHSDVQHPKKFNRTCLRCPDEIFAIAREGLDGILVIEAPAPRACQTGLPFNPELYKIETLFGPELPFLLPEGSHKIIGRIRNKETGLIVKTCSLRYNVTVRRCSGLPHVKSRNLRMSCTSGRIWGSTCAFKCRNHRAQLSHRQPIVCNENGEWIGSEPECIEGAINNTEQIDNGNGKGHCKSPDAPANGQYVCGEITSIKHHQHFKSGSICKVQCHPTYSIPLHLHEMSSIKCKNGKWDSTDVEVCYKKQPQRRRRNHDARNKSKRRSQSHPQIRQHNSNSAFRI